MPTIGPLRRILYGLLGAVPATYSTILLLVRWFPLSGISGEDVFVVFGALLTVAALLGTYALWTLVLAPPYASSPRASRIVLMSVVAGLCGIVPLCFLVGSDLAAKLHLTSVRVIDSFVDEVGLLWMALGPLIVGVDFILIWRRRASSTRFERSRV
jgi:hypothetical protein